MGSVGSRGADVTFQPWSLLSVMVMVLSQTVDDLRLIAGDNVVLVQREVYQCWALIMFLKRNYAHGCPLLITYTNAQEKTG